MQTQVEQQDIYQQVTDEVIRDLESGTAPWEKPWNGGFSFPRNAASSTDYSGINVLILWCKQRRQNFASSQWLTYNQALSLGGQVKRGEKATRIVYYKTREVEQENEKGVSETQKIPMLKTHAVFNLTQCEGLERVLEEETGVQEKNEIEVCKNAENLVWASGATIRFGTSAMAFYEPKEDTIQMPERYQFKDQVGFYATMLHELTHWTGHESRLDREFPKTDAADSVRANEELIAELGSSFLCAKAGLPYTTQHAAYIKTWLVALKNDKKAIFRVAARAREASEFLLGKLTH
jgi:antirestriction protein ArdC